MHEKYTYGYNDSHFWDQNQKLKNLWQITIIFTILSTYSMCHSFISFFWARKLKGSKCNVITNNPTMDPYFILMIYLVNLLLWQYPVLYILTPQRQPQAPQKPKIGCNMSISNQSNLTSDLVSRSGSCISSSSVIMDHVDVTPNTGRVLEEVQRIKM